MEFLFDTASIASIEKYAKIYPFSGVTTNPSILKAEGAMNLREHLEKIRALIGGSRDLHAQVIAADTAGMLAEANALRRFDRDIHVKIPATNAGLAAMSVLKTSGCKITATAIYTRMQAFLAITAGADFIAPYFNRMENLGADAEADIRAMRALIDRDRAATKILAASFKNTAQITRAIAAGAHAITASPELLETGVETEAVRAAVAAFASDWEQTQGTKGIA